jgi:hypothetical protein
MRLSRALVLSMMVAAVAACGDRAPTEITDPGTPTNFSYQLEPSGDPLAPLGVLLTWEPPANGRALTYEVYARSGAGAFQLRATTTSPSFHDNGTPQLEYFVIALDGASAEIGRTDAITIDERNRVIAPSGLTSITLNAGIHLTWSDNVIRASADLFDYYRVYSSVFDAARGGCTGQWFLEGTTSGEAFLVLNLANGAPVCFAVSAVSFDGHESVWSNLRIDTPRFDAKNVAVYSTVANGENSSFIFFEEGTRRLGVVGSSTRPDADLLVVRQSDGTLAIVPGRAGSTVQLYATAPLTELSAIDRAPTTGFQTGMLTAVPGNGYVFRLVKNDGVHYAAVRVAYVTSDYVVMDWAYQSAIASAELSRTGGR